MEQQNLNFTITASNEDLINKLKESRKAISDSEKSAQISKTIIENIVNEVNNSFKQELNLLELENKDRLAYLEKYGSVEQKRLLITEKYNQQILDAKTEHQKMMLEKDKEAALNKNEKEGLINSDPIKVLSNNIGNLGADQINAALNTARQLLKAAADEGKFTKAELKAMYDAISSGEAEIKKKNPFEALVSAAKNWDKTDNKQSFKNLSASASDSFKLVGDCAGTVVGGLKQVGAAGDEETQKILDNSLKLVGGLGDMAAGFATMNPAKMLQGAMAVFTSLWELCDSKSRNARIEIERIKGEIELINKAYVSLGEQVGKVYSTDASDLRNQQVTLLEKQKELVEQQKTAEKSKKKSDDKALEGYDKSIEDLNKKIVEAKEKSIDAIFGTDLKKSIDDFASAYANAFASGKDVAEAQKDVVKKMITNIVQEMIKSDIAEKVKQMREKIAEMIDTDKGGDGKIDDAELKAINDMGDEVAAEMEARREMYEKLLKGPSDKNSESGASKVGLLTGAGLTEQTAGEFIGIQRGSFDKLASIDTKLDMGFGQLAELARSNAAIEANTLATAINTANTVNTLANGFNAMQNELVAIKKNTSNDNGSYGG